MTQHKGTILLHGNLPTCIEKENSVQHKEILLNTGKSFRYHLFDLIAQHKGTILEGLQGNLPTYIEKENCKEIILNTSKSFRWAKPCKETILSAYKSPWLAILGFGGFLCGLETENLLYMLFSLIATFLFMVVQDPIPKDLKLGSHEASWGVFCVYQLLGRVRKD